MNTINRLQRDHNILRKKLQVLETALEMGPESWFVVRETCMSLSHRLADHLRRADYIMAGSAKALTERGMGQLWLEHHVDGFRFRIAIDPFLGGGESVCARATPSLKAVVNDLRDHMAQVETKLFPLLEEPTPTESLDATPSRIWLDGTMTVNHVIREYPETKPVFEDLFVSPLYEQYDCLDEVAWRHGLDVEELIAKLQDAIRKEREEAS